MRHALPLLPFLLAGCPSGVAQEDLDAALDRIDALEAELAALRSQVDGVGGYDDTAIRGDLGALDDRIRAIEGESFTRLITADTTIRVPQDFASVQEALSHLRGYALAARVNLQIADGTYTLTEGLDVGHRDGQLLRITGNVDDPSRVVLSFAGDSADGVYLVRGQGLDGLSGVTVRGAAVAEGATGVWVGEGAALRCRGPIVVEGFGDGIAAGYASSVRCDGAIARNNEYNGFLALRASSLRARDALAEGNGDHGFVASEASSLDIRGAVAIGNGSNWNAPGVAARHASSVIVDGGRSQDNQGGGFLASFGSAARAVAATAEGNGDAGFQAEGASMMATGEGAISRENRLGVGSFGSSFVAVWGGATITDSRDEGVQAGGSSAIELQDTVVRNNGVFGVNSFWGSFIGLSGSTAGAISGHEYDTNIGPSTDPTRTSEVHRWGE